MPLTDVQIRSIAPIERMQRFFDAKGLYLEVTPKGGKYWRYKYRFAGKEKRISLGVYPEISLKTARERLKEARDLLSRGIDPSFKRKADKVRLLSAHENTFELVAREWLSQQEKVWAESHSKRVVRRLEQDIFPSLGSRPISQIEAPELLLALRKIEHRGAVESAHRALATCGQIFRFAIATARAQRDPSRDLRGALSPIKQSHFAATTDPAGVAEILKVISGYKGTDIVRLALQLAPHVFVRPGELRQARWTDVDLEAAEWRFTSEKTHIDHIVPLSHQAAKIFEELKAITGDKSQFVFPSARSNKKPMSDNALLAAFRRMDIAKEAMTVHGWRAVARTLLDEVHGFRVEMIEQQLAHAVRDVHGRAYNRTKFLDERRRMMQEWSDYLDQIRG